MHNKTFNQYLQEALDRQVSKAAHSTRPAQVGTMPMPTVYDPRYIGPVYAPPYIDPRI